MSKVASSEIHISLKNKTTESTKIASLRKSKPTLGFKEVKNF